MVARRMGFVTPDKRKMLIEALRRGHTKMWSPGRGNYCDVCRSQWPCPPSQAADELERLGESESELHRNNLERWHTRYHGSQTSS